MTKINVLCTPRDLKFVSDHDKACVLMSKVPGLGMIQALNHVRSGAPDSALIK